MHERSDVPYGHASMLLLGEGSEATESYNEYEPFQINQVPCILAVTALILFRFENRLYSNALFSSISQQRKLTQRHNNFQSGIIRAFYFHTE